MGDLPLRTPTDRRLGGPLPRRQANQTHPHPLAASLCFPSDAIQKEHRVLIRLSPGYPLLRGRLDTRYSPVRRSSARKASFSPVTPRLACVKPVASVHPEPGSNSTLYIFYVCIKNIHSVSRLGKAQASLALLSLLTELYKFYVSDRNFTAFVVARQSKASFHCTRS